MCVCEVWVFDTCQNFCVGSCVSPLFFVLGGRVGLCVGFMFPTHAVERLHRKPTHGAPESPRNQSCHLLYHFHDPGRRRAGNQEKTYVTLFHSGETYRTEVIGFHPWHEICCIQSSAHSRCFVMSAAFPNMQNVPNNVWDIVRKTMRSVSSSNCAVQS